MENIRDTVDCFDIPGEIISDLMVLDIGPLKVYLYLRSLYEGHEFAASVPMIQQATGRGSRSVETDLKMLREKKFIIRRPGAGSQPNMYSFPPHRGGKAVDPSAVSASEPVAVPTAEEPIVTYQSLRDGSNDTSESTLPSNDGETVIQIKNVSPPASAPDPEAKVRKLIAGCYRPITDQEYQDLKRMYPDQ
jgi:hypothetical protein